MMHYDICYHSIMIAEHIMLKLTITMAAWLSDDEPWTFGIRQFLNVNIYEAGVSHLNDYYNAPRHNYTFNGVDLLQNTI